MRKLKKNIPFISFWILNSLLLYLATLVYPSAYVLGNMSLSSGMAAIVAGLVWTAIVWWLRPLCRNLNIKPKGRYNMFAFYWVANFIAIWVTARLSVLTGFGIYRFTWAIWLALVADVAQWLVWQVLKKK